LFLKNTDFCWLGQHEVEGKYLEVLFKRFGVDFSLQIVKQMIQAKKGSIYINKVL
jgi:hypothetical protein